MTRRHRAASYLLLCASAVWPVGPAALSFAPAAPAPAAPAPAAPAPAAPAPAPAVAPTPEAVEGAIAKGRAYLQAQQKEGTWEQAGQRDPKAGVAAVTGWQWGGLTSIATYALLASGTSPRDERLQPAIKFLLGADIQGIYAVGMRCQVWHLLPDSPEVKAATRRDAELLLKSMKNGGEGTGFYDYYPTQGNTWFDHSVSQYAVLGLWACAQEGLEIPRQYWLIENEAWRRAQFKDGAWNYGRAGREEYKQPSLSMTAAGVASLYIIADQLNAGALDCRGNLTDPAVEAGLDWIGEHFDEFDKRYVYYALYGIERIGVASGRKYLGSIDWYAHGADYLLKLQKPDGSWDDGSGAVQNTAFALLFLTRGRAPVAMNKLDYRPAAEVEKAAAGHRAAEGSARSATPWNERPRDVAQEAAWIASQAETGTLNWQVVTLRQPVEEFHDAPILYVSGSLPLKLSDEEEAKLKQFVEEGGLILANADCGNRGFADSVKKLGQKLFPAYGEFGVLPADHAIYTHEQFPRSKWRTTPEVLGLNNGVRELILLLPTADAGKAWHAQMANARLPLFELGADVFLYAVDKQNLRTKGDTYIVAPDPAIKPQGTIKVARLAYDGPWDPEPGGWRRLAAVMHNADRVDLRVTPVKLGAGTLAGIDVAHLTGTIAFHLDAAQRAELKRFVESGGTLVIDAAGGRGEFATAAENELKAIFPEAAAAGGGGLATPLPPDDPLYTGTGARIAHVGYRRFARKVLQGDPKVPHLRGLKVGGRTAVFYSPEDLTAGLVGQPVDGINGYDPATATALMQHLLLYARQHGK